MSSYESIYTRQGKENGPMNVNELHPELSSVNPEITEIIQNIKSIRNHEDVREAINIIACKEKRKAVNRNVENTENKDNEEIKVNENLVAEIQKDMKNRENITIERNTNVEETLDEEANANRDKIEMMVSKMRMTQNTNYDREQGA